mmetsp:Transcript_9011/g.19931  ORF Transcript_9011/g.19931 Transcript_9011/m.19931 type:complete len:138 (-) Transcript_9011:1400-1813(-)
MDKDAAAVDAGGGDAVVEGIRADFLVDKSLDTLWERAVDNGSTVDGKRAPSVVVAVAFDIDDGRVYHIFLSIDGSYHYIQLFYSVLDDVDLSGVGAAAEDCYVGGSNLLDYHPHHARPRHVHRNLGWNQTIFPRHDA